MGFAKADIAKALGLDLQQITAHQPATCTAPTLQHRISECHPMAEDFVKDNPAGEHMLLSFISVIRHDFENPALQAVAHVRRVAHQDLTYKEGPTKRRVDRCRHA